MIDLKTVSIQWHRNIKHSKGLLNATLDDFVNALLTGVFQGINFSKTIDRLRGSLSKAERTAEKHKLPYILLSGISKDSTNEEDIVGHTGFFQIDLDLSDNPALFSNPESLNEIKDKLGADPYIFLVALSPSGNGLKVIFYMP